MVANMKCNQDPVVAQVRKVRLKIFKECNYDPYVFGRFLAEREKKKGLNRKAVKKERMALT